MLRLDHVLISIDTEKGRFGRRKSFGSGLNVIRAENWAGKSTLFQSILYALGLEGMLAPSYDVPLPHVMTDYIDIPGGEAKVLSSAVTLELSNGAGERLTVSRGVVGDRDRRLIRVQNGAAVTDPSSAGRADDYFVRMQRAAVSERGFHHRLAKFIGWDLPMVPRFEGDDCPLYAETLFPLFFVEQKLGWGRVPGRFPTWFGIRDVRRRAIEFVLDLEAFRLATEKNILTAEINRVRAQWNSIRGTATRQAAAQGAIVQGIPTEPVTSWPQTEAPGLYLESDGKWQLAQARIKELRVRTNGMKTVPVETASASQQDAQTRLVLAEDALAHGELSLRRSLERLEADSSELRAINDRIDSLRDDQRKYRDVARLHKLGSEDGLEVVRGICPTCHQDLVDSLVNLGARAVPMSVEQNIAFYDEQIALFTAAKQNLQNGILALEAQISSGRRKIDAIRNDVRALRETLTSTGQTPSIAQITEQITLEQRAVVLENLSANFDATLGALANLADEWRELEARRRNLPKGTLSPLDEGKLKVLDESFHAQLNRYGFGSVEASKIHISRGDYEPQLEDMNLAADAAASDVIRLQWAYLFGLLDVAADQKTNHPRFLMLDEPQQQSVSSQDFFAMMAYASKFKSSQILIATSHEAPAVSNVVTRLANTTLWELGKERVIEKF